jgi:hypothetical protein
MWQRSGTREDEVGDKEEDAGDEVPRAVDEAAGVIIRGRRAAFRRKTGIRAMAWLSDGVME